MVREHMAGSKKQRLENAIVAIQKQHGAGVIRRASQMDRRLPQHISTSFPELDDLTGCGGVPLGAMTLFSGHSTSGKLTVAFKVFATAQASQKRQSVALIDLNRTCDPDYLKRAGVDLNRLQIVQVEASKQAVDLLLDLVQSRKMRVIVVNGLPNLQADQSVNRYLNSKLGQLYQMIRTINCALLWIDEPAPAWLRWINWDRSGTVRPFVSLHIELQWEELLDYKASGKLRGYCAQARLLKSRWAHSGRSVPIAIEFNGVIKARDTW